MNAKYGITRTDVYIEECIKYLKSIGYNCHEEMSLNVAKMEQSMLNHKPILMRLTREDDYFIDQHRIVVGGVGISEINIVDDIMTFTTATKYETVASECIHSSRTVYFYLNWGWHGINDAFYLLNDIKTEDPESKEIISWEASDAVYVEPNI